LYDVVEGSTVVYAFGVVASVEGVFARERVENGSGLEVGVHRIYQLL